MIRSFADDETRAIASGAGSKRFEALQNVARRKLVQLDAATEIRDLSLPGNRLEKLTGDRVGQWSIRVNDQYRICFRWDAPYADEVEIVDYH